jgi:hypothetical protein
MGFWSSKVDTRPWQDMSTAPRDGTPIEIKCTYGYEPWVQVGRWKQDFRAGPIWSFQEGDGFLTFIEDRNYGPRSHGANNSTLQWRHLNK